MIHDEMHFEFLTALAVAGQLSDAETVELAQHTAHCLSCAERKSEMGAVSRLLFISDALRNKRCGAPEGMQERFLMRAIAAGVPLTRPSTQPSYANFFRSASITVALLIILIAGWRARSDRQETLTKPFADVPNSVALTHSTIAKGRTENSSLTVRRTVRKQHSPRSVQVQTQHAASIASEGSHQARKSSVTLAPAFFAKNTLIVNDADRIQSGFTSLAADYFRSGFDTPSIHYISSPVFWNASEEQYSSHRVFRLNSSIAALSFLAYPSQFNSQIPAPDLSIHYAFSPIRFR